MAHDRMIRGEMRESERVNHWPIPVRYFWTQLWGYCDDHGRGRYDTRLIKAGTFPIDDEVTAEVVRRWMLGLEKAGVIVAYEVSGKRYFECRNWDEHQSIRHKKKTNVPDSSGVVPGSAKSFAEVRNSAAQGEGEGEREREVEGESVNGAPPSPFCPKHPKGTDDPCRPCGNARRARDAWEKADRTKPTARPVKFGECPAVIARGHHRFVGGSCAECSAREAA